MEELQLNTNAAEDTTENSKFLFQLLLPQIFKSFVNLISKFLFSATGLDLTRNNAAQLMMANPAL